MEVVISKAHFDIARQVSLTSPKTKQKQKGKRERKRKKKREKREKPQTLRLNTFPAEEKW